MFTTMLPSINVFASILNAKIEQMEIGGRKKKHNDRRSSIKEVKIRKLNDDI